MSEWVSVEDELPESGTYVLMHGRMLSFIPEIGEFFDGKWRFADGDRATGVTHWMPLPEPPKDSE